MVFYRMVGRENANDMLLNFVGKNLTSLRGKGIFLQSKVKVNESRLKWDFIMEKQFEWTVPSLKEDSLKKLVGCKVTALIKISYETFLNHLEYLDLTEQTGYRDELSFFKYSYGSLLITFDNGAEYSFGSAEDLNSVIMCCQKDSRGQKNDKYILEDESVLDITSVSDVEGDFVEMLNQKVKAINILTTLGLNSKQQSLPSDQGVEFIFENDKQLVLSHNLTENSFVFAVLSDADKILEKSIIKLNFK